MFTPEEPSIRVAKQPNVGDALRRKPNFGNNNISREAANFFSAAGSAQLFHGKIACLRRSIPGQEH